MTLFGRAATYCRISRDMIGDAAGVQRQSEDTDALADQRGIAVVHHFSDNDISATSGRLRPGYEALMEAAERGEIDCVIVWHLSRLWRNRSERADGMDHLRRHGVSVWCCKGPDLDLSTASGRMVTDVIGAMDSYEVELKSERQQRAAQQRAEQGKPPKGPRLFGYTANGSETIPGEAVEVRRAFEALLAGASITGICRDMAARGVLNRLGSPWTRSALRGMLLNARYAGLREYRGELYPGDWPAIISEDTWRGAASILGDNGRRVGPGPARRWLLTGIARCGVCNDGTGVTIAYRGTHGRGDAERIYRCRKIKHLARKAEPIEKLIAGVEADQPHGIVIERLSRPDAADLLIDADQPDKEELRTKAISLRGRLDALAIEFANDDDADPREFRAATKRIKERLAETEAKMIHPQRSLILADLITAEDPAAAWVALPLDRQRAVIDTLMTITVLPGRTGRLPFDPKSVKVQWKETA